MHRDEDLSWSLIGRAAAGDAAAREIFGTTYLPVVRGFLESRWRGTPWSESVDDALQEVFVECLRDNGALQRASEQRGNLGGFLFGVTRNVALRFEERARRDRRRNEQLGSVLDLVAGRETTLSVAFDRNWAMMLVRLAAKRMREVAASGSDGQRLRAELLRLRFSEGLPIRDIAARWKLESRVVHRAYEKARAEFEQHLRASMSEHGALPTEDPDRAIEALLALVR